MKFEALFGFQFVVFRNRVDGSFPSLRIKTVWLFIEPGSTLPQSRVAIGLLQLASEKTPTPTTFTFPLLPIKRKEENCPKSVSEASRTMTITTAMTVNGLSMSCSTEEGESEIQRHLFRIYSQVFVFQFYGLCRCTWLEWGQIKMETSQDYSFGNKQRNIFLQPKHSSGTGVFLGRSFR